MNPDYSLADWVSYRGTFTAASNSTYPWLAFRVLGHVFALLGRLSFLSFKYRELVWRQRPEAAVRAEVISRGATPR